MASQAASFLLVVFCFRGVATTRKAGGASLDGNCELAEISNNPAAVLDELGITFSSLERIGAGSFGVVYRNGSDGDVAVKLMRKSTANPSDILNAESVNMLRNDVAASKYVKHMQEKGWFSRVIEIKDVKSQETDGCYTVAISMGAASESFTDVMTCLRDNAVMAGLCEDDEKLLTPDEQRRYALDWMHGLLELEHGGLMYLDAFEDNVMLTDIDGRKAAVLIDMGMVCRSKSGPKCAADKQSSEWRQVEETIPECEHADSRWVSRAKDMLKDLKSLLAMTEVKDIEESGLPPELDRMPSWQELLDVVLEGKVAGVFKDPERQMPSC